MPDEPGVCAVPDVEPAVCAVPGEEPGVPSHSSLTLWAPTGARRERNHIHAEKAARTTKITVAPRAPPMLSATNHMTAPTSPAEGSVMAQAATMRPAMFHRTAAPRPTPEPRIEPVATWVVDSANPRPLEDRMTAAELLSAAMPCAGEISIRPLPRVRMMRQPPSQVPRAMAQAALSFTQNGMASVSVQAPAAIRARVMTPIVFWASLVPWARDTSEADPTWPTRKPDCRCRSVTPRVIRKTSQVPTVATTIAMTGEMRAGSRIFPTTPSSLVPSPVHFTPLTPSPAMVEPISPPRRAWEELDGRP